MIREANYVDIPLILEMGRKFLDAANYYEVGDYNYEMAEITVRQLINSDDGILLVTEKIDGMVGALVFPFFATGVRISQELFWWVNPGSRGAGKELLKAYEEEAKNKGAKATIIIALDSLKPDKVGNVLKRNGYRSTDHSYIKEL